MKALKEKRVSLRSLFRRSLVILSLLALALAFASCGGGSGSDEPTEPTAPTGTTEPTAPTAPTGPKAAKTVLSMAVIKHPTLPSYEGAAPVLTGLEVVVRFSDNTDKLVKNAALFSVNPPVAYVNEAGAHVKTISEYGRYTLQYIGDDIDNWDPNYSPIYGVNVYIPMVLAIDDTAVDGPTVGSVTDPDDMVVLGDLTVYEDIGVNSPGMSFKGLYASFEIGEDYGFSLDDGTEVSFANLEAPRDYPYSEWKDFIGIDYDDYAHTYANVGDTTSANQPDRDHPDQWDVDTVKQANWLKANNKWPNESEAFYATNPISADPKAWELQLDKNAVSGKNQAKYLAAMKAPATPYIKDQLVDIKQFYKVWGLEYKSGIEALPVFIADHKDLGGDNVARSQTVAYQPTGSTAWVRDNVMRLSEVSDGVMEKWWQLLLNYDIKFDVIYYLNKDDPESAKPRRTITISDYVKAMYTLDEHNTPRATLPKFTGATPVPKVQVSGGRASIIGTPDLVDPSSPQYWAAMDGDESLYLSLFYYSDLIDPTSTRGVGKLKPNISYSHPSGASVPIATDEVQKVAQFAGFDRDRHDKTDNNGIPIIQKYEVNTDETTGDGSPYYNNRDALYKQLKMFWDGYWLYDDPSGGPQIKEPVNRWYNFDGRTRDKYGKVDSGPLSDTTWQLRYYEPLQVSADTDPGVKNKYQYVGLAESDFIDIEVRETRDSEVLFPAPASVGPGEDDSIEFQYIVQP